MKISSLIEVLNKYKKEHGDIDFSLIDSSDDYGEANLYPLRDLGPKDDVHVRCIKDEYDNKKYLTLALDSDFDLYEQTIKWRPTTKL